MSLPPIVPSIVTSRRVVPNLFPPDPSPAPYRIAIVGEAPGEDEENHGRPFVGRSGSFIDGILRDVGIDRMKVFVGNVCQVRPPGNEISRFPWDGEEIQSGIQQLNENINTFNPNLCLLLGNTPLRCATGNPKAKITDWRGSLFVATAAGPFLGRKCLPSLHPAGVLREFSGFPLLRFDLKRAAEEGRSATLILPQRELITNLDAESLIRLMDGWPAGRRCSLDIEGGIGGWPCVSLCAEPTRSVTIAWGRLDAQDHARVLQSFARLMARTDVPKVLQNSLYDNFVLSYAYGVPIRNVVEDTMLKGWEIYCELPKGLGTQASIWTREPFYKAERKSDDGETFFRYCAKDSAVTLEICNAQDNVLQDNPRGHAHYRANVSMLNPLLYMELRGINYDQENVERQRNETKAELQAIGEALNQTAGSELRGAKGSLSSQRLARVLYSEKGYPPQYKREEGRKTDKLTTDVEAILNLRKKLPEDTFLAGILKHRHLEGVLETLSIKPDPDGRVRCGYNVVGTETGRLTCYTSPTGAGANLQTITKSLRKNYRADPGYDFFQCDLAGADGWTVAAHCARLGDRTMLDDYVFGLKPAKIIALLYQLGADVNRLDRPSLKNACRVVADDWLYAGSKVVQHGSNYGMGIPTMQVNLLKNSFKKSGVPIYLEHRDGKALQHHYFFRYSGVPVWHRWAESQLVATGTLTSASGHTRIFFGRRFGTNIHDTVKEFLADEPQQNTTWATNLAMLRLWSDPANRIVARLGQVLTTGDGTRHYIPSGQPYPLLRPGLLLIEPLHQVHDALCGQWPQFVREWARRKVKEYFDNPLTIADTTLTIPFEGAYGPSWGDLPHPL